MHLRGYRLLGQTLALIFCFVRFLCFIMQAIFSFETSALVETGTASKYVQAEMYKDALLNVILIPAPSREALSNDEVSPGHLSLTFLQHPEGQFSVGCQGPAL